MRADTIDADELDADGHRLVVRNGHARRGAVTTGSGPIEIEAPRVNDKRGGDEATGKKFRFRSSMEASSKAPLPAPETAPGQPECSSPGDL
jgi:hypothetical protein